LIDFKYVVGASASSKQKKRWKKEIEEVWDKKFKIHRKNCQRGDTCDCNPEQGCCSYTVHIQCEWGAGQGNQVELHAGANQASGWGTPLWWYSHTWWVEAAGVPSTVRAHEFGHQIGMWDEYPAGACDPARLYTNELSSIMNAGQEVYERHWVQILLATVNRGRIAQLRRQKGALQGTYGLSTTIDSQEAPNADTSTVDRRREALCR
jgi:hypothetical protein